MSEKIKELLGEEAEVKLAEKRYEVISEILVV